MTDNDADRLLTRHGETWRENNADRPGVDWEVVTRRRQIKAWVAVVAAGVAAAAVAVPLVVAQQSDHRGGAPTGPSHVAHPRAGAPRGFFALGGGLLNFVQPGSVLGTHPAHEHPVAVGAQPDALVGYEVSQKSGCRTELGTSRYRAHFGHGDGLVTNDQLMTVSGGPAAVPMAVSADGSKLALVVTPPDPSHASDAIACLGPEQIVVINLTTRSVLARSSGAGADELVDSLQFSPDGTHLAVRVAPTPDNSIADAGTHLLAVGPHLGGYDLAPRVLPLLDASRQRYGPVFWWHGRLVTIIGGSIRAVTDGGTGAVLASGLPEEVHAVSVAGDGDHLLLTAGPFSATSIPIGDIDRPDAPAEVGTPYRWDRGVLARLPRPQAIVATGSGPWFQPVW